MEMEYEAYLGNRVAGKVRLRKDGLYCHILCRCELPRDTVYRLYGCTGISRENLGVLMPDGDGFLLDRRIPAKRLEGCTQFLLSDGSEITELPKAEEKPEPEEPMKPEPGTFVPIRPEEPFGYLSHLESAFLEEQNGQIGINIQENPGAV